MIRRLSALFFLASLTQLNSEAALAGMFLHESVEEHSRSLVNRVAIIDEEGEEGRLTEEEYALKSGLPVLQIQTRFAATGVIKCGKYTGSAQLTGANDTITTSAHMFSGAENCAPGVPAKSCTFTTRTGNDVQTQPISELVATGFKCPGKPRMADDWAVLKLQNPIRRVTAYSLPSLNDEINPGDKVISVSGSSVDFQRVARKTGQTTFPKSIEGCQIKKPYFTLGVISLFESTCDFSGGNSGGSILRMSERGDVLVGISKSNDETEAERTSAARNNIVRRGKYSEGKWATYHVPVAGDFLNAIERANSVAKD